VANGTDNAQPPADGGPLLSRREQLLEVAIVLFMVMPSALAYLFPEWQASLSFRLAAFSSITRDLGLLGIIWLLLRRDAEPMTTIGWAAPSVWKEVGLGVLLFVPFRVAGAALMAISLTLGVSSGSGARLAFMVARGPVEAFLGLIMVGVVALTEETVFRGYLIHRLSTALRSATWAVALSTVLFSLLHAYQGPLGVLGNGFAGLVFALVYLWRKSLIAPIVMHFALSFVIIVLPALVRL
jgi:membrane protease YdiL (CAAX protease family)